MATYQVADGHDNEAGYANLTTQPACEGVRYAREVFVQSGQVYRTGERYARLKNNVMTASEFTTALTEWGVASAETNDITVTLPGDDRAMDNWNGTVVRPYPEFKDGLYRDVEWLVKQLVAT